MMLYPICTGQIHEMTTDNASQLKVLKYLIWVLFQCMLWSWYLADDTQFYVLGCMLLIVAVRSVLAVMPLEVSA